MAARGICAAVVAAASLAFAGGAGAEDIRIGAVLPLSGPNAVYGDIFMAGASLAADHANADKLLNGKLVIQAEDSQALPQQGVTVMNKLANVEKVPYVLSAFTGVSKAISAIGHRTKTVMVNGGAVGPDLAELGAYFWNVIPLANFEVRTLVPYLVKTRGFKRWVMVYVDDPAGNAIRKEIEANMPAAGGELVEALSVPVNAQQFSGIAARVRDLKPDVVYFASYGAQQLQLVKQLRDNGVTQPLATYSAINVPETNTLPEALGIVYTTQQLNWAATDPVTKRFVEDFKAKYGKAPSVYHANYYNAARLFALLAASLQKQGKPITGENLLAERLAAKSFDFVGGTVSFEANGTVVSPIQINEVDGKGGKVIEAHSG